MMKLTKQKLRQIIQEELKEMSSDLSDLPGGWASPGLSSSLDDLPPPDPLEQVLELLDNVLSEVEIDAGAYDDPRSSVRSGQEGRDRIRAQTASNYLEDLREAIKILSSVIEKDSSAT